MKHLNYLLATSTLHETKVRNLLNCNTNRLYGHADRTVPHRCNLPYCKKCNAPKQTKRYRTLYPKLKPQTKHYYLLTFSYNKLALEQHGHFKYGRIPSEQLNHYILDLYWNFTKPHDDPHRPYHKDLKETNLKRFLKRTTKGGIQKLELDPRPDDTWLPHYHILLETDTPLEDNYILQLARYLNPTHCNLMEEPNRQTVETELYNIQLETVTDTQTDLAKVLNYVLKTEDYTDTVGHTETITDNWPVGLHAFTTWGTLRIREEDETADRQERYFKQYT